MIVDTSAVMAVALNEPDHRRYSTALGSATFARMSAGSWTELGIVLARRNDPIAEAVARQLIANARVQIAPVDAEQARLGWEAFRTYGRGTGHPAALNFGDCFAYALAKSTGEPLLFKGDDFARTDITPAI